MKSQPGFVSLWTNCRGQMAIFIALIFQVLFVLFAMAINVALVVHDKINLQNAVDLAAYYAAERQAEMLNVIAHENYMIRQSWKLLAWRYRVQGAMGMLNPGHPVRTDNIVEAVHNPKYPGVCVTYKPNWLEVAQGENLCKAEYQKIPALPRVPVIAGFLGINFALSRLADRLRDNMRAACSTQGAFNLWFGLGTLQAFREDQKNRKLVIYSLANNLSHGADNFYDLDGNLVADGVAQTLRKNLTWSNASALGPIKVFNSFEGLPRQAWLADIKISPTVFYLDPPPSDACEGEWRAVDNEDYPARPEARVFLETAPPNGLGAKDLLTWRKDKLFDNEWQYALGVEKNPWYMAYVGVQAESAPRQIFFPFGKAVSIKARAFAKPFGGRIGPWYGGRWPRSAQESMGDKPEDRTDQLVTTRTRPGGIGDDPNDYSRLPNYSRFPGDQMGLFSALAINSLNGFKELPMSFNWYLNIWQPMQPGGINDPMAFDYFNPTSPDSLRMREYEMAAIAPDLFDVTYYSIEPNFRDNYLGKLRHNRTQLGIDPKIPIRGDLGSYDSLGKDATVEEQMRVAEKMNLRRSEAFYFVRDQRHLLTAWTTGEFLYDYTTWPGERFGQCGRTDEKLAPESKVPGSCPARGGRNGYSVKLVSRDLLFSPNHSIGGVGEARGPIKNPPPQGW